MEEEASTQIETQKEEDEGQIQVNNLKGETSIQQPQTPFSEQQLEDMMHVTLWIKFFICT